MPPVREQNMSCGEWPHANHNSWYCCLHLSSALKMSHHDSVASVISESTYLSNLYYVTIFLGGFNCLWFQTTTSWCGFSLTVSCLGFAKVFGDSRCGCWESEPDSSKRVASALNYWAISPALAEIFYLLIYVLKKLERVSMSVFFSHFIFSFWNAYCVYVRLMNIVPRLCLHTSF